ncbi:MAG: MFS transporter [Balneolaceae bacterium]
MSYLIFALKEKKLLSFGLSFTFFSSFGQTFLISLFVPFFLTSFDLSNAAFGSIYSLATLASALALPWLGQWIDHIPLRWYSLSVAAGLFLASILMSISWSIPALFVALLLLRLAGQGLSGHTAQTTMARYYDKERGKALSISSLGYPLGEAILPLIIAGLLTVIHWRTAWAFAAVIIGGVLIPVIYYLAGQKSPDDVIHDNSDELKSSSIENYKEIISDSRFFLFLPAVLMPPFWITGLFLYQITVAADLGWSATLIASAFIAFALSRIVFSLFAGPLVDRFSAKKLFPYYLFPMIIGLLTAISSSANWTAFSYMLFFGITMGAGGTIKSALWAEVYGKNKIGTVRSLFSSLMVLSTALSPFLIGWALDLHINMNYIFLAAIISSILAVILAFRVFTESE